MDRKRTAARERLRRWVRHEDGPGRGPHGNSAGRRRRTRICVQVFCLLSPQRRALGQRRYWPILFRAADRRGGGGRGGAGGFRQASIIDFGSWLGGPIRSPHRGGWAELLHHEEGKMVGNSQLVVAGPALASIVLGGRVPEAASEAQDGQ